jgi:hypothetical protein
LARDGDTLGTTYGGILGMLLATSKTQYLELQVVAKSVPN